MKKKLLIVADFACATGFASVSTNIAKFLRNKWDIHVLALNYMGDPHELQKQFTIYPASLGGDVFGINRINALVKGINPNLIFIINDIWIINEYLKKLEKLDNHPPVVFYTPVDAKHLKKEFIVPLNKHSAYGVFYTQFGLQEAIESGLSIPHTVIPHGVDTGMFYHTPMEISRKETLKDIPESKDWFIVLMCDRNQPRKRLDLGIYFFSEWVKRTNKPQNVMLWYHGALQDMGIDVEDYMAFCGMQNRLIVTARDMTPQNMLPVERLRHVYSSANIFWKPCPNEGWGLTLHEAMACGVPSIVPRSSALAEWPANNVEYVDVHEDIPNVNINGVNTIFDTPRLDSFINGMEKLYNDATYRKKLGYEGMIHATSNKFQWKNIAAQFDAVFDKVTG